MTHNHPIRALASAAPQRRRAPIAVAGVLLIACSSAALAALPALSGASSDDRRQWNALGIAPLANGGSTGMRMTASDRVTPADSMPARVRKVVAAAPVATTIAKAPLRIQGRVGDGLYWSLRAAGASPDAAAQYLSALAGEIDVGDVVPGSRFDLVLSPGRHLLYAAIDRPAEREVQLVRWTTGGKTAWVDATDDPTPEPVANAMAWPVDGRITSHFGHRVHPILRFTRFHAGIDFGAPWGTPIVASADGQVVRASWAGGYGRQVRIAHGDGLQSSYSHMSQMAVAPGSFVRRGQVIGYVGSSGLSTGPHLHYEVLSGGRPVNPLDVRLIGAPRRDPALAAALKARVKALLSVGAATGA